MPYIGKPQSADAFRVTPNNIDSELKLAVSGSNDSEMALATASIAAITASISRLNDEISTDDTDMTLATASIAAITASISRIDSEIDTTSANMTLATASIAAITSSISTINDNMTLATASIAAITASLGQPVNTDSNVTFNDINSTGTITAVEVHTTFVSSSIAVVSGSNIFGDATDDHHSFTGSLSVSGSLTATGSATVDGTLTVGGTIDFNSGTIDLSTQTVDVTLNGAVDALNFDSNTLSIDASNNRIGIGTASPDYLLDVEETTGGATGTLRIHHTSNTANSHAMLYLVNGGSSGGDTKVLMDVGGSKVWNFGVDGSDSDKFKFSVNADGLLETSTSLTIDTSGNVGIGTDSPTGLIHADAGTAWNSSGVFPFHFQNLDPNAVDAYGMLVRAGGNDVNTPIFEVQDYGGNVDFSVRGNGKVGIGVASPTAELDVRASSGDSIIRAVGVEGNHAALELWGDDGDDATDGFQILGGANADGLYFRTSKTAGLAGSYAWDTRMFIKADGKVGIGTTAPSSKLHILQVSASTACRSIIYEGIRVQNTTGTAGNAFMGANAVGYAEFGVNSHATGDGNRSVAWVTDSSHQFWLDGYGNGTEHFRIASNGDLTGTDTAIGSISDERTKQNVQTYSGSLSIINTLRPVTYEWKSDRKNSGRHRGFIAQEVTSSDVFWVATSSVAPGQADWEYLEGTDSMDIADPTGSRTALVSKLTAKDTMYVSAIQELTQAVRDLRAQITGSTDINQLKALVSGSTFV